MRDCSHLFETKPLPDMMFVAGDCSFRKYYRFQHQGKSLILMDAPPPENPGQFCRIAKFLKGAGLSAPHILREDLDQGFLVLEDFGDQTFTYALNRNHNPEVLYSLALDVLIHLHQTVNATPDFLPLLSAEKLRQELDLFTTWYWPDFVSHPLPEKAREEFFDLWSDAYTLALQCPQSVVLKDFHVDNLMILEREGLAACGLLDFQDALWGPIVYDVVSLLEDERRDISPQLADHLWQKFVNAFPAHDAEMLKTSATILAAGRHVKNLGVFARMNKRFDRPEYLQHIPRMWGYIHTCLQHPALTAINAWFKAHVPSTH